MNTINVTIKKPIEASKELERLNFKTFQEDISKRQYFIRTNEKLMKTPTNLKNKKKKVKYEKESNQFQLFQKSMRILLILGQCLGLNPFLGVTENNITRIRFTMFSGRFLYAVLILVGQMIGAGLSFLRLMRNALSIGALGFVTFYISTASTTFLFLRISRKWPKLVREIYDSGLNEFVDNKVQWKCKVATSLLLIFAFVEHLFALINRIVTVNDCRTNETVIYEEYMKLAFPWVDEAHVPYYWPLGILLQFQTTVSTMNWNYSNLFLVCLSIYLTSIFEQINKKVLSAYEKTNLTPAFWCSLREAYNRATRLVRHFDEVISGIVFTSFATNLFFICLQLFNVLANGITSSHVVSKEQCPQYPSGSFRGYEYTVYLIFSLFFLFGRSIAVSLYASAIHTASQVPAPALYAVPSCMYCEEIQRFIDQVHGDKVALSGLHFFYVTRELALSMAAAVVTYELVLLQFSNE